MPIEGLHKCQPENIPHVGDVKNFTVEQIPARDGKKAWLKIKGDLERGAPYEVMTVKQAFGGKADSYGNLAFNLEIEPQDGINPEYKELKANQNGTQSRQDAPQRVSDTRHGWSGGSSGAAMSKDDYWARKEDHDREREARFVANQPRIERQHSQEMMLRYFAMRPQLLEACTDAKQAQTMMREVTDHFQKDIGRSPLGTGTVVESDPERAEDYGGVPNEPPF